MREIQKIILFFTFATAAICLQAGEDMLELVKDGQSQCVIITGEDDELIQVISYVNSPNAYYVPLRVLDQAADDLAKTLEKIGGVKTTAPGVRVVEHPEQAPQTTARILLGEAAIKEHGLQREAAKLDYNDYVLRVVGTDLLIFGRSSKGTANGVSGFLQEQLGVRWFGPQELFTVFPERQDIAIPRSLDKTVKPSFPGLQMLFNPPTSTWGLDYGRRVRCNCCRDPYESFANASHNLWRLIPSQHYFKNHPEYYKLFGGKRRATERSNWNLCWSNPELIELASEKVKRHFRQHPTQQSYSLGMNDTAAYCECPKCARLQPKREFRDRRVASDMYYHFVNQVAKRVAEEFPERYLGVIAYQDVTAPPLGEMQPNVFVMIVNDFSEYHDQDYRRKCEELISDWKKKDVKLGLYYYTSLAKLTPAYFPRLLAEQLKKAKLDNVVSLYAEAFPGWPWTGPMIYLDTCLRWDVDLDPDAVLKEYFQTLFGPAAEPMERLYDLFEDIHSRPRRGGFFHEHYNFAQFNPYTAADLAKMKRLLSQAHAAVKGLGTRTKDHPFAARVAYVSNGLKPFLTMLEGKVLAEKLLQTDEPLDNLGISRRLEIISQINTILNGFHALYRENIVNDPYQSGRFRGDTCAPVREAWRNLLGDAVCDSLVEISKAIDAKKIDVDPRILRRWRGEVDAYTSTPATAAYFDYRTGKITFGPNQVPNSGFEAGRGDSPYLSDQVLEKLDWGRPEEVGSWAFYPPGQRRSGVFTVSESEKYSGQRSGLMRGTGEGYYIAVVHDVKPNSLYLLSAFVKNTAEERDNKPVAQIRVQWQDANHNWLRHLGRINLDSPETGRWIKLERVVKTPPGIAKAVILVRALKLVDGECLYIDDVSLRPLGATRK